MSPNENPIQVYLEVGQKRTFAIASDWPGWCRSGRDEGAALQALYQYAPRYARALQKAGLPFAIPSDASKLVIAGRLVGNATTDFGAPDCALSDDTQPIDPLELQRFEGVLNACWTTLDEAVRGAQGRDLRKGPRGGGRDLMKIVQHTQDVRIGYLASLGRKFAQSNPNDQDEDIHLVRQTILTTLGAAARGELPAFGPRGGVRWTPRYFVRRLAWHELDHAWEIEDRAV
ncbi:MAG: hypothetical protein JNM70_09460 [Anaerolineae bacterium]|nr:hypothetical protein [Anaerolineae bacterium]